METKEKLEIIRLIKLLDYLKVDYQIKNELYAEYTIQFNIKINDILNEKKELSDIIKPVNNSYGSEELDKEERNKERIKKIYRNIVKKTHPDKIIDSKLNTDYIEATQAYDNNSLTDMILICERNNIPYDIELEDKEEFIKETELLKSKILMLERTYSWRWFNSKEEKDKNAIILDYIKTMIN
jgi:hypothetical protein